MEAIPATNHLHIEFESGYWRLVSTELDLPTTLVEATPEGIVAHPVFRAARALPSVTLAPAQIMRVMLGWAPENQAWRLGMLLIDGNASKYDTTQMQWCELAAWPDATLAGQIDGARLAGQALARLINRPFQFVEPHTQSRVSVFAPQVVLPALTTGTPSVELTKAALLPAIVSPTHDEASVGLPDIQPMPLPLRFAGWRLTRISAGLRWRRVRGWWFVYTVRLLMLGILSVLFLVLGIGSKTRGWAQVEPERLPDAGIIIGVLLFVTLLFTLWQLLNENATVVDTFQREVYAQGLVLPFIRWRIAFDQIQYLLISQTPPRAQGRPRRTDPMRIAQEVWLHIFDGTKFYLLAELGTVEGQSWDWDVVRTHSHAQVRRSLQLAHYDTPAHHAAEQIANPIAVPVYLDLI